jgi:hypothetical protein
VSQCSIARSLQRRDEPVGLGEHEVRGAPERDPQRGVEQIRRRHPVVHPAAGVVVAGRRDRLHEGGEEGDDVVVGRLLDLGAALGRRDRALLDRGEVLGGDDAQLDVGLAGEHLDLDPGRELRLVGPQRAHLGQGVTGDHSWDATAPRG